MWSRLSPHGFMIFITVATLVLIFSFMLSGLKEYYAFPSWLVRILVVVYLAVLFLWPLDLLVHSERISSASVRKDCILVMVFVTVILYVFPVYWYGTLPFQTGVFAGTVGLVLPTLFITVRRWYRSRPVIAPEAVLAGGSASPEARRFLDRFPDAIRIVYGLSPLEGERAHLLLHKRQPVPGQPHAGIDLVMDIPVTRRSGEHVQNHERLHCYLFLNRGDSAGVGLLPSTNIGRAIDYGFSDEEMEEATGNALASETRWPVIGDMPLQAQLHRGPVYRL